MHKVKYLTPIFFLFFIIIFIVSCSHYNEIQTSGRESTSTSKSHNSGQDCMSCHHDNSSGASGTGKWWYFAGTAYNNDLFSVASSGGTIELWTGARATGTFLYRVQIDRDGNFYSSKIVDFKGGYYPVIIKNGATSSKDTSNMTEMVSGDNLNKSCNSCHGNNGDGKNTSKIYFN